jgi:integrase
MRRAYETDWWVFATWCAGRGVPAIPCVAGERRRVLGLRGRPRISGGHRRAPIDLDPLERLIEPIDTSTRAGVRDRALLLVGFAAELRRSELVAFDVEHLEFKPGARADDADRRLKDPRPGAGQEHGSRSRTRARETDARFARSGRGLRPPGSTAAPGVSADASR